MRNADKTNKRKKGKSVYKMIKIEKTDVYGWEAAIRGMRNPMNSWEKSDSHQDYYDFGHGKPAEFIIGKNDHALMMSLAGAGSTHAKYRRMINVTVDITAPLYWWKEFDTYKVSTVANSCSTMHRIHAKEFTLDDFSHEHLMEYVEKTERGETWKYSFPHFLRTTINQLNLARDLYIEAAEKLKNRELTEAERKHVVAQQKRFWWQMIQLLPSSYNQKRTVQLNYEVLVGMYRDRRNHKLDEWRNFCDWICTLPHSELIIGEKDE
jgi:predicted RNA-binding protein Jag